ncbi:MAG: hypothetical protein RIS76_3964 [Verrucomicrobiota bacterium]|jgi:hypothetical protein
MQLILQPRLPAWVLGLLAAFTCWTAAATAGEPLRLFLRPDEAPLGEGQSEKIKVPLSVHLPEPGWPPERPW